MQTKLLVIIGVLAVAAVVVIPFTLHPAEAHITKVFNMTGMSGSMPGMPSNIAIKIGWVNEPPLVGETNAVQIFIYNGTSDNAPPIADTGMDNMTATIQYGGQTKTLSFDASDDTPGEYDSAVRPTQAGTYNMIIKGTIDGLTIPSTTYPLQDVETKDVYYFPALTSGMAGMNMSTTSSMGTTGNQTVPEFGPIASLVLVVAIVSAIVVTGRTRFLKF